MNNAFYEAIKDNFLISTNPILLDVKAIYQYLSQESYWAKNIPLATVEKSIKHSLCFGMYDGSELIGFARLITDMATFAYLCDVFVMVTYRKRGLSKWLMQTIHMHPELQGLRRWLLGTRDAQGLYQQFGWEVVPEDMYKRFMQLHFPDVYVKD
ncbi:GNAT family N-acetyltransferase [Parasediminibacterium paludis]|uniref:GNAT family N-acetyltransferase n=1 Tax=Parasediminibacterium paludis TaxID=908966 RepID=A0ABV8PYA9_9BACT